MSVFYCESCQKLEDSDSVGIISYKEKEYCYSSFYEEFDKIKD